MTLNADLVAQLRAQFPAFNRRIGPHPAIFLDGPAGSQVPQRVVEAMGNYLVRTNANHGGLFATSRESDEILDQAHAAAADLMGTRDPGEIIFGANMTTLTFALSRALARTWKAGDRILVTRLDHDANVTPWVLAACDVGATVEFIEICRDDCTLDMTDLRNKLVRPTRLVAVGCASNSVGTVNPVQQITQLAHDAGALVFLDAVHYAPHGLIDVPRWNCDFLACSAYKFFGPHVGVVWGRRALLQQLEAYKVRPAPHDLPGKWMTGTQNQEGIAGTLAALDYLAQLGRNARPTERLDDRRAALVAAYEAIVPYERELIAMLIPGLKALPDIRIYGITDPSRFADRFPTVSITHARYPAAELARRLGEQGIFVWHGNYYALQLSETLGLEPDGMVRIGLLHYNTPAEVERLLEALREV